MASRGITVMECDMEEHAKMKGDALTVVQDAIANPENGDEKLVAAQIKRKFDELYGPTWHCIAGSDFKAKFTYRSKSFIFLDAGKMKILLYRTG